jgi:helicase required for RNAi-mediated heterochromatin assembly 1
LKELKSHPNASGLRPNVFTVDSYQGEENDIILLSLVRSNLNMGIGFLNNKNRLVVGVSRARRGLYLFGNAVTLTGAESCDDLQGRDPLWFPLLEFMGQQKPQRFVGALNGGFPITCAKHGNKVIVQEPVDWVGRAGGCNLKCNESALQCGHPCPLKCHPFDHSIVVCTVKCPKTLRCGHRCSEFCGTKCYCKECRRHDGETARPSNSPQKDLVRVNYWEENEEPIAGPSQQGGIMKRSSSQQLQSRITFARGKTTPSPENSSPFRPKTASRAWRSWDAKQADTQAAEQARLTEAARPKTDKSTLVFQETWHPTTTDKNGNRVRATCGPIKTTVPRFEPEALLEGIESMTMVVEKINVPNRPATFTPVDPEDDLIVL